MLHRNFRGEGKNPGSTNKYTKFGQLIIIKKHLNYCHQMSNFNAKMHRIRFLASVRLSLWWSLTRTELSSQRWKTWTLRLYAYWRSSRLTPGRRLNHLVWWMHTLTVTAYCYCQVNLYVPVSVTDWRLPKKFALHPLWLVGLFWNQKVSRNRIINISY